MRLRVWGGLLLVLLAAGIMMTMGCEKGALGVKPSTVMGRVVDAASSNIPVVGAKVSMVSQTGSTGGGQKEAGYNYVTLTDTAGQFIFENVAPDQLQMMIEANGYAEGEFPSASGTKEFFYVGNGVIVNLGDIKLVRISQPLSRTSVIVRAILVDAISKDELNQNKVLSLYIAGEKYQNRDITYSELKNGLSVPASLQKYGYTIIAENYQTLEVKADDEKAIDASVDNVLNIQLNPITYSVRVTFRNKPFYINNQARELNDGGTFSTIDRNKCTITIYSAIREPGKPYKILATDSVSLDPYEPETTLTGISLPASLTVLLSGYREMTFSVPYTPDTQGMIAMKLNMEPGALSYGVDVNSNKIFRPTLVRINPDADNLGSPPISLRTTDLARVRVMQYEYGLAPLNTFDSEAIPPTIRNVPCGYILPFEVHAECNVIVDTTNYVYVGPVHVPVDGNTVADATFTASLLISMKTHVVRP